MIETLARELRLAWPATTTGREAPRRVHIAKLSHEDYPAPDAAFLVLLFADRDREPSAVAKVARVAAGDATVRREAEILERLGSRLPADLRASVPHLLRRGDVNGRAFWIGSFLRGEVEMHHTWGARGARRAAAHLDAAMHWAGRVAEATRHGEISGASWFGCDPQAARQILARVGCDATLLEQFEARLVPLWSRTWPAGLAHGDYFPGNVLFASGGGIGVVDWAQSEDPAPLFWDVLTYELSFGLHAARTGTGFDDRARRAVNDLPAFAATRRVLSSLGVEIGLGSEARRAVVLRGLLRDATGAAARVSLARAWATLLAGEVTQGLGP